MKKDIELAVYKFKDTHLMSIIRWVFSFILIFTLYLIKKIKKIKKEKEWFLKLINDLFSDRLKLKNRLIVIFVFFLLVFFLKFPIEYFFNYIPQEKLINKEIFFSKVKINNSLDFIVKEIFVFFLDTMKIIIYNLERLSITEYLILTPLILLNLYSIHYFIDLINSGKNKKDKSLFILNNNKYIRILFILNFILLLLYGLVFHYISKYYIIVFSLYMSSFIYFSFIMLFTLIASGKIILIFIFFSIIYINIDISFLYPAYTETLIFYKNNLNILSWFIFIILFLNVIFRFFYSYFILIILNIFLLYMIYKSTPNYMSNNLMIMEMIILIYIFLNTIKYKKVKNIKNIIQKFIKNKGNIVHNILVLFVLCMILVCYQQSVGFVALIYPFLALYSFTLLGHVCLIYLIINLWGWIKDFSRIKYFYNKIKNNILNKKRKMSNMHGIKKQISIIHIILKCFKNIIYILYLFPLYIIILGAYPSVDKMFMPLINKLSIEEKNISEYIIIKNNLYKKSCEL